MLCATGLFHMTGFTISKTSFSGIVTIVLPISTLLNPIINVFTTKEFFDTIQMKDR